MKRTNGAKEVSQTIQQSAVLAGYNPEMKDAWVKAMCNVVGSCAKKPLGDYEQAIARAAEDIETFFALSPEEVGIPLITNVIMGLQLVNELEGQLDEADADKWIAYHDRLLNGFLDAKGIFVGGDPESEAQRSNLRAFVGAQAIAVLRGGFDEDVERSDESLGLDLNALFAALAADDAGLGRDEMGDDTAGLK